MTYFAEALKAKAKTTNAAKKKPELFGIECIPMTSTRPKPSAERIKYLMEKHFQKMKLPKGIADTAELVRQDRADRAMGR
jgi:hypothetical protein